MDDEALRQVHEALNERPCPFVKVILAGQAGCVRAQRICLGERIAVGCASDEACTRCTLFLTTVRTQARFALRKIDREAALTHAQAQRLQIGGLRGVRAVLWPEVTAAAAIADIDGLLLAALDQYGELAAFPWAAVIQQIAAFKGRREGRGRRR